MNFPFLIMVVLVAPAVHSFSYLDNLSGPSLSTISETESPFFFTNTGVPDETASAVDTPAFFFTNSAAGISPGSYSDNCSGIGDSSKSALDGGATSVSGIGMTNYFDVLPRSSTSTSLDYASSEALASSDPRHPITDLTFDDSTASSAISSPSSYLDALSTDVSSRSGGSGIITYASTLGGN